MLACVQTAKDRSRWHSSFPLPRVATQSLRSASCRNRRSSFCMRASDRLIFCIQRQTLVAGAVVASDDDIRRLLWRYGQWYHSVTDFWFCMTGNQMYRVGQRPPPQKKTPFVLLCSNCESILFCIVVRTGYSCNYQYKKPVNSSILLWCHLCIKK